MNVKQEIKHFLAGAAFALTVGAIVIAIVFFIAAWPFVATGVTVGSIFIVGSYLIGEEVYEIAFGE